MTRLDLRTLLRRRLQEGTADNWSDAILNTILDHALSRMIGEVKRVDPFAFVTTSLVNTVSGTATYAKPADAWGIYEVALLDSATSEYRPIKRIEYDLTRPPNSLTSAPTYGDTTWYHFGTSVGIYPTPTASVTNGLRYTYFPNDTFADDSDSPTFHVSLHYGVVLWAAMIAIGETEDDAKFAKYKVELQEILATLREIYTRDLNEPVAFRPSTRGTRRGGTGPRQYGNGIDIR